MFETTIAGSLPKPAWLAEPNKLWAPWRLEGADLEQAKRDATLLAHQGAGGRRHRHRRRRRAGAPAFRARLPGARRGHRLRPQGRDGHPRRPLQGDGAAGGGAAAAARAACTRSRRRLARAHTRRKLKFTLPGPMTIVDTIADAHYGDKREDGVRLRRAAEPGGARAGEATASTSSSSTSRPSTFHGRGDRLGHRRAGARGAGPQAAPPPCTSATATASRPTSTGRRRWAASGASTRRSSRRIAKSSIEQVSLECRNSKVPLEPDRPAGGQGHAGRRHRRRQRRGRDARAGGGRWPRQALKHVPTRAHPALHQLRHGAHAPRHRLRQARGAGERGGVGSE